MSSPDVARLVPEFRFDAQLVPPLDMGPTPRGQRLFFDVGAGEVHGERLRGKVLSGGDWLLVGPDGFGRLDVRAQIQTHDGAYLYMYYHGVLEMNPTVLDALANGKPTDYGDAYLRTSPVLETGDPRYAWVNQSLFIGAGHLLPGGKIEYQVYRVA